MNVLKNNGNGATSFRLLLLIGCAVGVAVVTSAFLLNVHAQQPHSGAVSRHEFNLLRDDIKDLKQEIRLLRRDINVPNYRHPA